MKNLLIIISFLCVFAVNAQSVAKKGITPVELQTAKDSYAQMMGSETYRSLQEHIRKDMKIFNGVIISKKMLAENRLKSEEDIKEVFTRFVTENIHTTKLTSVKQGVELMMKGFKMEQKLMKDNAGLYALMGKATKEQLAEILEVHFKADRDRLYNSRN